MLLFCSTVIASDYDWMRDFNIRAEADPSGFRARLEARFQIGDAKIRAVLDNSEKPADAYMCLRLGEISDQPIDHVIDTYKTQKGKGWGAIAKSLGIKPGSNAFHELKHSDDLYEVANKHKGKEKGKGKKKK
jgi:hypothetical protein